MSAEANSKLRYVPSLDGLRAFAVIAVLLYHADLKWIPGGFLGVDVFFVLSGYLITSLLLAEWRGRGTVDLKTFWIRRARRLLPAMLLILAASLTFAVLFLRHEVSALRSDAIASIAYVTNWHLILSQRSYFAAFGRPSLFRHLWSLAIEGQFYLLWPVVFTFALVRWPARRILLAILALALLSAGLMAALFDPIADPSRIYFGTDTRATALLVGAALAMIWAPGQRHARAERIPFDLVGFSAFGLLIILNLRWNEFTPALYRGGFALVAIATAVLIAVAVHPRARFVAAVFSWRPLRWIGTRSYGIYLWHWPIFMLTRPQLDVTIGGAPLLALRLLLTGILAEVSYRCIETPIRRGALGRSWHALRQANGVQRRRLGMGWLGAVAALMAFFLVLGRSVAIAQPPTPPAYLAVDAIDTTLSIEDLPAVEPTRPPPIALVTSTPTPGITHEPVPASATPRPISSRTPTSTPTSLPTEPPATPTAYYPIPEPHVTRQSIYQIRRAAPAPSVQLVHVVKRGENLFRIALRYGTTFEAIAMANHIIHPSQISTGQHLTIPDQPPPADSAADDASDAPTTPTASAAPANPSTTPTANAAPASPPEIAAFEVSPTLEFLEASEVAQLAAMPTATATPPPAPTAAPQHPPPTPMSDDVSETEPSVAPRVTAIGDSVMLGAVNQLVQAFGSLDINAQVSRQFGEAISILNARRTAGRLSPIVILHVGNNGIIRHEQIDAIMQALAGVQRVVFVNIKVPRRWEGPNNTVLAETVPQYANAVLIDWYGASIDRPDLFWSDGIHLRPEGAEVYAALIALAAGYR